MNFLREFNDSYRQVFGLASRNLARAKKQGLCICPPPMNSVVDEKMISYRLDLGVLDIPVLLSPDTLSSCRQRWGMRQHADGRIVTERNSSQYGTI